MTAGRWERVEQSYPGDEYRHALSYAVTLARTTRRKCRVRLVDDRWVIERAPYVAPVPAKKTAAKAS